MGTPYKILQRHGFAMANAVGMRPFFKIVSPNLMNKQTWNVLVILLGREEGFALSLQAIVVEETSCPVEEKEEVVHEIWERSEAVFEALRNVAYLYLKHSNSSIRNNALHTAVHNWR